MTDVKIRCDECKFVEDCVDYGWEDCKKFTQKPSEPMTNEEWLRSCTTEQLAEFLTKIILDDKRFRMTMVGGVNETKMWLKQPHHEKE